MFLRSAFSLQQQHRLISQCSLLLKGHSKWDNIKKVKGKNDMLRSKQISFLVVKIKSAIKSTGGFDIKLNSKLAALQQEFRAKNLPLDTFNNVLIKLKNKPEMPANFEFIGPSGSFFVIETETDSPGKTRNAIQKAIGKIGGFRQATDLRKRFDEKIVATVSSKKDGKEVSLEDMEEIAIELDCEEVAQSKEDEEFELTFGLQNTSTLEDGLKNKGLEVENIEQRLIPIHRITISSDETAVVEKFYSSIQEIEEVKNIFDNLE